MRWSLCLLLLTACAEEPPCGEGWTRERYSNEFADAWCTLREECYYGDYGWFEAPDHAGCAENVVIEVEHSIEEADAQGCYPYDSCDAQRNVEDLKAAADTCEGSAWFIFAGCP